ncbi:MAG: ATP-dependent DNA ligase [Dehalococcoidia bacterium]
MTLGTPFQPPLEPMLARLADGIPEGDGWLYEPKWDGFRAIAFLDGTQAYLQSRDLKPLARYFPDVEAALLAAELPPMVLDGEIVVMTEVGLDFGALQLRLHPAASRVQMLAEATPAAFVAFDLLALGEEDLRGVPFEARHARLSSAFAGAPPALVRTPSTRDRSLAADWFDRFEGAGFDGIIAKRLDEAYQPGARALVKVKHLREADCVVGGFRWAKGQEGRAVGSILLGLYDADGVLHHVGHTSSFDAAGKRALVEVLTPHIATGAEEAAFGLGRTPGGPSRWTQGRNTEWVSLRPELVCEVAFDHLQGDRFRHGATFRRWRPDKPPASCRYDQLAAVVPAELREVLGATM